MIRDSKLIHSNRAAKQSTAAVSAFTLSPVFFKRVS